MHRHIVRLGLRIDKLGRHIVRVLQIQQRRSGMRSSEKSADVDRFTITCGIIFFFQDFGMDVLHLPIDGIADSDESLSVSEEYDYFEESYVKPLAH